MDVGYADNAGAITCLLIGDEKLFGFLVMRHSDASRARVDFRDPATFPWIIQLLYKLIHLAIRNDLTLISCKTGIYRLFDRQL